MSIISQSKTYSLEKSDGMLRIMLPSRKKWLFLIISVFCLALWLLVGLPTVGTAFYLSGIYFPSVLFGSRNFTDLSQGFAAGGVVFLLFLMWASLWAASGGYILYEFFYQLVGYEIMEIHQKSIILIKQIFRFRRAKEFSAELIRGLRVIPYFSPSRAWSLKQLKPISDKCAIAFDYEAKVYLFGIGSNLTEAKEIVLEIEKRFPQYQRASN